MINKDLATIFFEMADLLETKNVEWKPQAYRAAARSLDSLKEDIIKIQKRGELEKIPGVGEGIAKKIVEYIKTGKIKAYEELKGKVTSHVSILIKIPGMGPKKLKKLNSELNIKTIEDLRKAALNHKIACLPGFGAKSEQDILENIDLLISSKGKIKFKEAEIVSNRIISQLIKLKDVEKISTAGSLRRKKPLIRDIDIIISSNNPEKVISKFSSLPGIKKVLAKGPTKATMVLNSGIQVDLRVLLPKSWGAGLFYFTGSKNYNIEMRRAAIKKGYKLNEYGLFNSKNKIIASKTEKEICKKLGVKYLEPQQREI
ncbi:helix-hairpin-helix domain-containing protein [Nanoarchaeota archaeon]